MDALPKYKATKDVRFVESLIIVMFVAINIISNVIAGKIIALPFGLSVAGASLLIPLVLILDDCITNVMGYQTAKKMTWISIIVNLCMSAIFMAIVAWPSPVWFENSAAYATVLGQSVRVVIASIVSFWCSSFLNSYILQRVKVKQVDGGTDTMNKWGIFLRTFGSSIPAQLIDSMLFAVIAFAFTMDWPTVIMMGLTQWGVKLLVELIVQPIVVNLIPKFSKAVGMDAVDRDGYNPFKMD